jgi:hypothetical protein
MFWLLVGGNFHKVVAKWWKLTYSNINVGEPLFAEDSLQGIYTASLHLNTYLATTF